LKEEENAVHVTAIDVVKKEDFVMHGVNVVPLLSTKDGLEIHHIQ